MIYKNIVQPWIITASSIILAYVNATNLNDLADLIDNMHCGPDTLL